MQAGIFRVCLVVVAAIVNHPLLFPRENTTLQESDKEIIQKMKEHEENLKKEQQRLEQEITRKLADHNMNPEGKGKEANLPWDLWSAISMIIFLLIEIWRQDVQEEHLQQPSVEEDDMTLWGNMFQGVFLPNKTALAAFCERFIRSATNDAARTREFVEGFADDLLEALRSVCNRDTDMEVEDSIGVGSMYENWRVNKPLVCDLFVPFAPPEPYRFRSEIWDPEKSGPQDRPGYGKIKVCRPDEEATGCICDKTKLGEDMLCLLHSKSNEIKLNSEMEVLLCSKNTQYLDTDQVMKWFQIAITKAWNKISHKYEFDVTFSHLDSPGALKIRFRSGKFITLNITPVVQYEDSDVYFISHFPSSGLLNGSSSTVCWFLSFAVYERRFLKEMAKHLPENSCHLSCLQLLTFLHGKQSTLTGQSGLSNYHLKTVLLHLLLARPVLDWSSESLEARLKDLLKLLEKSLHEKKLYHFMIGNKRIPATVCLPETFLRAEPLNLFQQFVLHRGLYKKTMDSFYEMLKNTSVLINEYTVHVPPEHTDITNKA
ncbi:inositol 1,4,5-trisphosphate receptor-interacting protein [Rhinatrema bivittatum]|uniref:inositol 1,4,5-trisphosphate receptor-interacting protein n=1 Tax=Rhinatrema bivittatum TaxID=194408 RepID=UPI00112B3CC6|nr:inositol 1,4,5-trisphosphate receptor-interacting protein [Rhinatrema bivittatum]XP_029466201.1 inositol 1,4,5-trisphosphate receptor-interacting protein [Rhinatrema bivittatum]XP_029466202.1 inositol 1,4,5-trisphosphate receptor-interacting protein [Rhinatrema bivittatum]